MSGAMIVRQAMTAALRGDAVLAGLVNQVSEGEPLKASAPWLMVGETVATGWGARGVAGLRLRVPIDLVVRGDDAARVTAALARADMVLRALDDAPEGWRITSLVLERSRIRRDRTGWRASADYAVRAARLD